MPDLQINEKPRQNQIEWKVQRIFWLLATLILLASCLGYFGSSPFTKSVIQAGSAEIEYPRFARTSAKSKLVVRFNNLRPGSATVFFPNELLERVEIEKTMPEPSKTALTDGGITFVFDTGGSDQKTAHTSDHAGNSSALSGESSAGVSTVTLTLKPEKPGSLRSTIRVAGQEAVLEQFVYP